MGHLLDGGCTQAGDLGYAVRRELGDECRQFVEARRVRVDVRTVDQSIANQNMGNPIDQRDIAPRLHRKMDVGHHRRLGDARVGAEIERARLESENVQLAGRLETRKAVERAKAVMQRDLAMTEDEAYRTMQRESRQRRISMREIAEAILLGDDLKRSKG